MQNRFDLLVTDVMPIYMIIPRYSHNYAQFCQLLNSNLFTHRRKLMLLREATSETYGPRVYSHHINLHHFNLVLFLLSFYFSLCIFISKAPKMLLIGSHFRKWPWRDWQPLIALVALSSLCCVGTRDLRVASYWIDTLVLKNWGKYLRYSAASSFPLRGKPTQAQEVAVCGTCFAELDTILVFKIFYGVFGGGTRLAMPKKICTPDSSSLKPGSGATEGVLD